MAKLIQIPSHQLAEYQAAEKEGLARVYGENHPSLLTANSYATFDTKDGNVYSGRMSFYFPSHTTTIDIAYDADKKLWRVTRDFND